MLRIWKQNFLMNLVNSSVATFANGVKRCLTPSKQLFIALNVAETNLFIHKHQDVIVLHFMLGMACQRNRWSEVGIKHLKVLIDELPIDVLLMITPLTRRRRLYVYTLYISFERNR